MGASKAWSLLIFAGAYNDLQPETARNLARLCALEMPPEVEVLLQAHMAPGSLTRIIRPDVGPAASFESGRWETDANSRLLMPVESGRPPGAACQPSVLFDFLAWGLRRCTGRRVVVALSGHSAGILGVLEDSSLGYPILMTIPALAEVLAEARREAGRQVDILVLDSCDMDSVEILCELACLQAARLAVAAGADAPPGGVPYEVLTEILAACGEDRSLDEVVQEIVSRVNDTWSEFRASPCIGVHLDRETFEQFRSELSGLAEEWLKVKGGPAASLPVNSIRGLMQKRLAPLVVCPSNRAPVGLRLNLPSDHAQLERIFPSLGLYRISRSGRWPQLLCRASRLRFSGRPDAIPVRGMVALPRELLLAHMDATSPGMGRPASLTRIGFLGWGDYPASLSSHIHPPAPDLRRRKGFLHTFPTGRRIGD